METIIVIIIIANRNHFSSRHYFTIKSVNLNYTWVCDTLCAWIFDIYAYSRVWLSGGTGLDIRWFDLHRGATWTEIQFCLTKWIRMVSTSMRVTCNHNSVAYCESERILNSLILSLSSFSTYFSASARVWKLQTHRQTHSLSSLVNTDRMCENGK